MRILKRACFLYLERFKTILAFSLLLPILFLGLLFGNNFVSGGSFFYSVFANSIDVWASFIFGAIFLLGFSILSSVLIYSLKTYFYHTKIEGFKEGKYLKYAVNLFYFYVLVYLGYLGVVYLIESGLPDYFLSIYGLIVLLLMYVPQAMILENARFFNSFFDSLDFIIKNKKYFFVSFFSGLVFSLAGILLDYFLFQTNYILSYLIAMVFFVFGISFLVVLNTYLYSLKNPLVRSKENAEVYDF